MEQVITIPEKFIKEKELILLPRSQYEELLRVSDEQKKLDEGIQESLEEVKQGKIEGPFENADKLMKSLSP